MRTNDNKSKAVFVAKPVHVIVPMMMMVMVVSVMMVVVASAGFKLL